MTNSIKEVNYFYCYSPQLRKHLSQSGLRWSKKDIHKTTGKTFWIFEHVDSIAHLLEAYTQMSQSRFL